MKAKSKKKAGIKKGDKYRCGVCGLVIKVDDACGCVNMCDIVCCDKPMKKKRKTK
ncbi:MAG: hypothetical protein WBE28_09190 [bacterium]